METKHPAWTFLASCIGRLFLNGIGYKEDSSNDFSSGVRRDGAMNLPPYDPVSRFEEDKRKANRTVERISRE